MAEKWNLQQVLFSQYTELHRARTRPAIGDRPKRTKPDVETLKKKVARAEEKAKAEMESRRLAALAVSMLEFPFCWWP